MLSNFIQGIREPQTIKMAKMSRELRAQGVDVTDLSLGEPDFSTPQYIKDAAIAAINEGYTKYPPVAGYPELRQAVCDKFKRDNDLEYMPQQVVVSTGAKQALANVMASLINPGDEVIIPTPYWVTYSSLVKMFGGVCVFVSCPAEQNFKLTADQLEAHISGRTRMLIYSSPCNPSGAVYSRDELAALKDVLVRHPDIYVVSDEIYEYINYTGQHQSMAHFGEMKDRTIIVNGMSKGYAMTGWRIGYIAAPVEIASACEKYQSQITSGANSVAQRAALAALLYKGAEVDSMVEAFTERRAYFIGALSEVKGFRVLAPEGAFYAFVDVSYYIGKEIKGMRIDNTEDFALFLLREVHVTGVPGGAFGDERCIRFSFATSSENLHRAIEKLKKAFN